ncbi:MAG: ABC transporter ATP-binding protein [Lachnospira sp.]|nr:ABC transporter ATP-binding protein [Lachnospira sp.]
MSETILEVKNLRTQFKREKSYVTAIHDVSFSLGKGEIVGLVGESGCGKSVTSMSIMRLLGDTSGKITDGEIRFKGKNLLDLSEKEMQAIRGSRISMIFQDPMSSLNPPIRIEKQMIEAVRIHENCSKEKARKIAADMLHEVGIPDVENTLRSYPHQLSGGMCQRVMIAMAMACKPELLIADEPTTALDVTIQAQIMDLMKKIQKENGTTILLITHDLGVVAQMCSRVLVMYAGRIVEQADVHELFYNPKHPYTKGLIACVPKIGSDVRRLPSIPGSVPDLSVMPKGCKFAPRCQYASDRCRKGEPDLVPVEGRADHWIRCYLESKDQTM